MGDIKESQEVQHPNNRSSAGVGMRAGEEGGKKREKGREGREKEE